MYMVKISIVTYHFSTLYMYHLDTFLKQEALKDDYKFISVRIWALLQTKLVTASNCWFQLDLIDRVLVACHELKTISHVLSRPNQ